MPVILEPTAEINLGVPSPLIDPIASPSESRYHCAVCGAVVDIGLGLDRPLSMLLGASGKPNMRVITLSGIEVHSCPFPR